MNKYQSQSLCIKTCFLNGQSFLCFFLLIRRWFLLVLVICQMDALAPNRLRVEAASRQGEINIQTIKWNANRKAMVVNEFVFHFSSQMSDFDTY